MPSLRTEDVFPVVASLPAVETRAEKPDALAGVYITSLGKCVPRFAGCVKNVLGSDHKLKKIEI